ncbi:MAG TPA: DUF1801 domain-containing protein [Blastocatellia bacterium]|nr:DUF1801 domain-containing protein [Blastocatellia bacterium]
MSIKTDVVPPPTNELLGYLAEYNLSVGELALALREIVFKEAPDAIETVFKSYVVSTNYSFTGRWTQGFCYIAVSTRHVTLGFVRGVDLPDPEGVLIGEGKQMRHIKIHKPEDLKKPYVRPLIRAAIKNTKADLKRTNAGGPSKSKSKEVATPGRNKPASPKLPASPSKGQKLNAISGLKRPVKRSAG